MSLFYLHVDCSDRQEVPKCSWESSGNLPLGTRQFKRNSPPLTTVPARILPQHATMPATQPSDTACPNSQPPSDPPVVNVDPTPSQAQDPGHLKRMNNQGLLWERERRGEEHED